MKNDENNKVKKEIDGSEKITIKTGRSSYSFNQAWVENEALKDILVGLVADDLDKNKK